MDRLSNVQLKRSQMNTLVMDYLVAEGFKEAAERFKVESGVEMSRPASGPGAGNTVLLDQRIAIRQSVEEGHILKAIRLINEYHPELLDQNRTLFFKLQVSGLLQ